MGQRGSESTDAEVAALLVFYPAGDSYGKKKVSLAATVRSGVRVRLLWFGRTTARSRRQLHPRGPFRRLRRCGSMPPQHVIGVWHLPSRRRALGSETTGNSRWRAGHEKSVCNRVGPLQVASSNQFLSLLT